MGTVKTKVYMHQSRVAEYCTHNIYCRTELVESSGVDDTCYGQFKLPIRVNQLPVMSQGLQQVRRIEWDQQDTQSAPELMGSIRL